MYCGKMQRPGASVVAQLGENPPAVRETWVRSLGWEDPLEKGKATHSGILVWGTPWTSPWGRKEPDTTEPLSLSTIHLIFFSSGFFFNLNAYI